ncbi:MAG: AAA family ATPase [Nitrospirae bacterium]|nr:AAA family ATPase [Nitrospirota bacterium]
MEFSRTTIWAFGGGKGGVGKSVLCANIAIALAHRRKRVILIDADLGGANLHTYLGISSPKLTLLDFIQRRKQTLEDVLIDTGLPNLRLISGASDFLELANPKFTQKQRMIQAIQDLAADLILIDLGAGTHFNILDFFNASHDGIVVVCPEPASIQNGYRFIKNALYRKISQEFYDYPLILEMLDRTASPNYPDGCKNLLEFGERIRATDQECWERFNGIKEKYRPRLIINKAQGEKEMGVAEALRLTTRKYLDIDLRLVGYIPEDYNVKQSTKFLKPFYLMKPKTDAAQKLDDVIDELLRLQTLPASPSPKPAEQPHTPHSPHLEEGPWRNHPVPGINEDLTVEGRKIHIQTEDLGPATPAIQTQVFAEGRVLFKKTIPYPEEAAPHDRETHLHFLRKQHRTLISGIRTGSLKLL